MNAGGDEPYFLGSIVLIRPPKETVGQVVDGQQRLTTLTILAAVLRDLETDETRAKPSRVPSTSSPTRIKSRSSR